MKKYTYASAFAGIGGMTLGLKDLGFEGLIAWEYDPSSKKKQYAQEAHKLLHPDIKVEGDICASDTKEIPDFDVFCFTPPCQAFSLAGKRGGFDDTRGTLTFEALRIAKDKKPKILFMENVKGLVNHDKGNTMGTIINAINDIGYIVDFTILNSKYFDVAQNRERVYLIAVREDLIKESPWIDIVGNKMLPKAKKKYQQDGAKTFNFDWPKEECVRTKLLDFLESYVDEKYYLDQSKTNDLIFELEKDKEKTSIIEGIAIKEATKKGYDIAQEGDSINFQFPNSKTRRGRVGKNIANTLEASNINQGVLEKIDSTNLLGLLNIKGTDQIRRVYGTNGQCPTLTTMQGGMQEPKIYNNYRIRKLTPTECLRLQSVPQWAIDILVENFSDSRLYKFAGNGLTTNVITAIGERIRDLLNTLNAD